MKTPARELKKDLEELLCGSGSNLNYSEAIVATLLEFVIPELLQKEKAFAFDCFEAGSDHGFDVCMSIDWGDNPRTKDFEQFYSQYAEQ